MERNATNINYYQKSIIEIDKIKRKNYRPVLGIHVCCGPCACFPLEFLNPVFKIIIIYTNSNIYPQSEYELRLSELRKYVFIFNKEHNSDIEIVVLPYENEAFTKKLEPLKDCKERGERCHLCYSLRMNEAYDYADSINCDYFTTVMTVSRQKDSQILNQIGALLEKNHKAKYFYSDFKKKKGIDIGQEICKKCGLYCQRYCGCLYSYQQYLEEQKKNV